MVAQWRAGTQRTLYEWGTRTTSPDPCQVLNGPAERGGHIVINVSAVADTPSVVPTLDGYDSGSGAWYNILTGAAITAAGTVVLKVYPGVTAAAGLAVADVLPQRWRLVMTHADTDAITYSVSAHIKP